MRDPGCTLCPLHELAHTVCVDGRWREPERQKASENPVMVVGMAPGAQEDVEGMPFVGPSGVLLERALQLTGVAKPVWLTNAVRCFPGRDEPDRSQVKACAPYLDDEIEKVRPAFMLTLGNLATQRVLGKGTMANNAGKEVWSNKYQCWVMPAHHPAYILRQPGRFDAWVLDIARFARLVSGDIPLPGKPPVRVRLVETDDQFKWLLEALRCDRFTYDFEALPVEWWHKDWVPYTLAFSTNGESAWVLPLGHPESPFRDTWRDRLMQLIPLMTTSPARRWPHNGMYDDLAFYRCTGHLPIPTDDSMIQAHLLNENQPKALKWLGRAHLGWPDWDIDARKEHPLAELAEYNGYDAAGTWLLGLKFGVALRQQEDLWRYYTRLEMPKLRMLERMVARGIEVDRDKAAERGRSALSNYLTAKQQVPVKNPRSAPQVARWLFDDLGLTPIKMGKQHGSTDEDSIKRLAQQHPEVRAILPVRKWTKYATTYFANIVGDVDASFDHRYHPDIRTAAVETGRLSSFHHTIPRDPFVRGVFTARTGHTLLECDSAQVEARLCAWAAAGAPAIWEEVNPARANMLLAFRDGRDIYREQAAQNLYDDPARWPDVSKQDRQIMGKVPVLAMLYRISPRGLREYAWREYEIDWTDAQARRIWLGFHKLWPEFNAWHERCERAIVQRGWTRTVLGRVRRLPEAQSPSYKIRSEAVGAGINAPIQGLASDITQAAGIRAEAVLAGMGIGIVGNIHDALLLECPDRLVPTLVGGGRVARWLERAALDYLAPLGLALPPGLLKIEIKMGAWGEGVEVAA